MCDEWMPVVRIPMSLKQYHQLPRHPAFKYEYLDHNALLTPRAKFYHARLVLSRFAPNPDLAANEPFSVQPIRDEDFPELTNLFSAAFRDHQPYASLDRETRQQAASQSLEKTRTGRDGPWLREASFLVRPKENNTPVGAVFITLLPDGDARDSDSYFWREPAPDNLVEQRGGQPHLTWIFANPWQTEQGAGTILLGAAVQALIRMGYTDLLSTFLVGNHSSTLWHWRCGFELLSNPFSVRRMRREIRES